MPNKSGADTTAARITTLLEMLASSSALPSAPSDAGTAAAAQDEDSLVPSGVKADAHDLVDGIQVRLIRQGTADTRIATHASQASITLSEARRMLSDRLLDKDSKMRENVVVCAGDPDRDGTVLPLDVTAFELLAHFGCGELPPVSYVKRAWLHLTGTTELIPLIRIDKPELIDCGTGRLDDLPYLGVARFDGQGKKWPAQVTSRAEPA